MLKFSKLASRILQEREELRREARRLALHVCQGHISKIEAFCKSLWKRGGVFAPGVELTWCAYETTNLVFLGDEESLVETLTSIKTQNKPSPESVVVKMLVSRMIKVIEGIEIHNAMPVLINNSKGLLPPMQLSDFPDFKRYWRNPHEPLTSSRWQVWGNGKACLELRKVWRRPDVTPRAIELAWQQVAVRQIMEA